MAEARMNHDEIRDSLGVYALHAVGEDEAAVIAHHVDECSPCQRELCLHLEVTAMLAATERSAPPALWDAISDRMHQRTSKPPSFRDASFPKPPVAWPAARSVSAHRRWFKPAAAAIILLAAAATTQSLRLRSARTELVQTQAQVAERNGSNPRPPLEAAAAGALESPGSQLVILGSQTAGPNATIVLQADGTGYLTRHQLPPLPPDRTYQLWAIVDGKTISAGVLGAQPEIVPFRIDPTRLQGFAITEEQVGGVEASRGEPVAAWMDS